MLKLMFQIFKHSHNIPNKEHLFKSPSQNISSVCMYKNHKYSIFSILGISQIQIFCINIFNVL